MYPIVNIFGFKIYTYTIFFYSAILISFLFFLSYAKESGYSRKYAFKLGVVLIILTIIGSRALFLLSFLPRIGLKKYLLEAFSFWSGGLSIITSITSGIFVVIILAKILKIDKFKLLDLLSPALFLGLTIGRIGCFMAGCCYGKATDFFLGVTFNNPDTLAPRGIKIHPVQIYESWGAFLIFLFLLNKAKKKKFEGEIFSFSLILYSILRLIMEKFRADSLYFFIKNKKGNLIVNLNIAVLFCLLGLISGYIIRRLKSNPA